MRRLNRFELHGAKAAFHRMAVVTCPTPALLSSMSLISGPPTNTLVLLGGVCGLYIVISPDNDILPLH